MANEPEPTVVVCAELSTAAPLRPGREGGFSCLRCKQSLQATPAGAQAIRKGGLPLCNRCGFELIKLRQETGKSTRAILGPEVLDQLAQLEEQLRKN